MEEAGRSRSPSRRPSRVEQVVGRWLRRSRDLGSRSHSLSRDRVSVDGKGGEQAGDQRSYSFRFTVQIQRSSGLNSHGLSLTSQTPILVQEVTAGGPADGRLVPGDQLVKINNVAAEDLTPEQAAEIIRECQDIVTMTVLRTMVGPKSSFITPEKRAKLRSNPVKVHFAEEVEVNGNSQGNTLLFLPNVLKVYLENGQTKAFKFEPNTTVKDIVMTLKEKLSLCRIEPFCLVLEQQPSVTKLLLLHEEERIQQVVQKKESHDYRCLFRVCYMPKDPRDLLLEDPTAFEYLYFQGVNDVLQERFAVEMRCNTALRLAALHIQERLASCGQSPKTNLKTITKTWGIENFVSSTLLRNMREKDLRKAVGYHMKKSQSQQDPKQKGLSFNQARINYLEELCELKSFMGKSFSATMLVRLCVTGTDTDRATDRHRQRDRETDADRATDRATDRHRQRDRETDADRATDRATDRHRQRDRETERQTQTEQQTEQQTDIDRETERQRDRQTDADRETERQTQTERQRDRETDADRETERQRDRRRQSNRQT
ncbi:unnamed protein product [Arctogadus glacialis]